MRVSWLLIAALGLLAVSLVLDKFLQSAQAQHEMSEQAWTGAINQSRLTHRFVLGSIRKDPALGFAIRDAQSHSLRKLLNNYIRPGEIDAIRIFSSDCRLLAKSRRALGSGEKCPHVWRLGDIDSKKAVRFTKDESLVTWVGRVEGGKKIFVSAEVILGEAWKKRWLVEAESLNSQYRAGSGLPEKIAILLRKVGIYEIPFWFHFGLACLAFVLSFSALSSRKKQLERQKQVFTDLENWCNSLEPKELNEVPLPSLQGELGYPESNGIKEKIGDILASHLKSLRIQESRAAKVGDQLNAVSSEVEALSLELADRPFLYSLAKQVEDNGPALQEQILQLEELIGDLAYLFSHEMISHLQALQKLSYRWQRGCSESSARKFIRTLSERVTEAGVSELTKELQLLYSSSQNCVNLAINSSLALKKLSGRSKLLGGYVANWVSFTGSSEISADTKLEGALQKAVELASMLNSQREFHVIKINLDSCRILDETPINLWVSSIYHCICYLVLSQDPDVKPVELTVEHSEKNGASHLVFSSAGDKTDSESASASRHLDIVERTSRHFPIEVQRLPSLDDRYVVGIKWLTLGAAPVEAREAKMTF